MAKRDTKKTLQYSIRSQTWSLDIAPSKKTKKAKAKSRQEGRKECREVQDE